LNNPVTDPKRSQKPKRPRPYFSKPNGYSIFLTALRKNNIASPRSLTKNKSRTRIPGLAPFAIPRLRGSAETA
jgi:hypothetical protein